MQQICYLLQIMKKGYTSLRKEKKMTNAKKLLGTKHNEKGTWMIKEGKLTDGFLWVINNGERLLQEKKAILTKKRLFYIKSRNPY